jgi:hypothetical protein
VLGDQTSALREYEILKHRDLSLAGDLEKLMNAKA